MIGNWEISGLSVHDKFFAYAIAYLDASIAVSKTIEPDETMKNWPMASVAIMLSAHSVELFLKGAILFRDPGRKLKSHRLMDLKGIYDELCPETELCWEIPFKTEYVGMSKQQVAALAEKEPVPSVQYRYPTDSNGSDWNSVEGFIPNDFILMLNDIKMDYVRIQNVLRGT